MPLNKSASLCQLGNSCEQYSAASMTKIWETRPRPYCKEMRVGDAATVQAFWDNTRADSFSAICRSDHLHAVLEADERHVVYATRGRSVGTVQKLMGEPYWHAYAKLHTRAFGKLWFLMWMEFIFFYPPSLKKIMHCVADINMALSRPRQDWGIFSTIHEALSDSDLAAALDTVKMCCKDSLRTIHWQLCDPSTRQ